MLDVSATISSPLEVDVIGDSFDIDDEESGAESLSHRSRFWLGNVDAGTTFSVLCMIA